MNKLQLTYPLDISYYLNNCMSHAVWLQSLISTDEQSCEN